MDERQQKIREGAGLEESRLNVEFIDWLRRWSTPFLLVVAVVALSYVVYQRVQQSRLETLGTAFVELEAARSTAAPNPRALEDIARAYRNVRGVPYIALLAAGDEYLRSARLGVAPGAEVRPDGTVADGDLMNQDQRDRFLADAERLYREVLQSTQGDTAKAIHAISAAYGLAAVAEMRGDLAAAKAEYERVIALSEAAGYASHVAVAHHRIENLPALSERQRLYAAAELPPLPGAGQAPEPDGAANFESIFQQPGSDGGFTIEPLAPPQPVEPGDQTEPPPVEPPGEPDPG
jgi:hypothetical protein